MKRIVTNNEDQSFENKEKFEDLLNRIKALGGSIVKNGKQTLVVAIMAGTIAFSANNVYKIGKDISDILENYKIDAETYAEIVENVNTKNDEIVQELNEDGILVVQNMMESIYHFEQNNLCDIEGNMISLNGVDKPIYIIHCNINNETFKNIQLSSSTTKSLCLDSSSIDDTFINYLPSTLELLSLDYCNYITNLEDLPARCPNISMLYLNCMSSLSDLEFIYKLPNLKLLYISDSAYITEELLNYLKENNIDTNLTEKDIINSQMIDGIISNIITPNMSDEEKIQAICMYVLNNVEYDMNQLVESNQSPLSSVLENEKGVCASYAYLTNVLLRKADIKSFEVTNDNHAWNIVSLNDKYYYVDTTNMDVFNFYNGILKKLNLSKYYMIDPNNTKRTPMSSPNDKQTIIPLSLIEDIQNGRNEKDIFERYAGQVGIFGIYLGSVLSGVATFLGIFSLIGIVPVSVDLYENIRLELVLEKYNNYKNTAEKKL